MFFEVWVEGCWLCWEWCIVEGGFIECFIFNIVFFFVICDLVDV